MGEEQTPSEEQPQEGEQERKAVCHFSRLEETYDSVVQYYRGLSSPETVEEVLAALENDFQETKDCGCKLCTIRAVQTSETYVVLSEILKLIPASCERGVAGLIFRMYTSRQNAVTAIIEAGLEKLIGGRGPIMGMGVIMGKELMEIIKEARAEAEKEEKAEAERPTAQPE